MMNASRKLDVTNPKLRFLRNLIRRCYTENVTDSKVLPDQQQVEGLWCPRVFDGLSCWDDTPANATTVQRCPDYIVGFDPRRNVFKRCTENGSWSMHPDGKKAWTNYSTCVDYEDLDFRYLVNNIYVVGYAISVAALFISLAIFMFFRTLHCTRIRIHMQLFVSFALNNILWIVWYKTVVNTASVVQENGVWCQLLHILTNFFMVTSYFWMFCEGLHLHIALVVVFVKDDVAMIWFNSVGWGLSLIVTLIYATARYFTGATERCWTDQSETFWIIATPVVISLLASLVFLINVVRVLVTKLRPVPNQHASAAAKKAVKASLILIPLFGLHYILIPLRPANDSPGANVYQVVSALLTSLQGACVSVLFCFTNQEVMATIKNYVSRMMRTNEGLPMTGVTGAESMMNTRENVV